MNTTLVKRTLKTNQKHYSNYLSRMGGRKSRARKRAQQVPPVPHEPEQTPPPPLVVPTVHLIHSHFTKRHTSVLHNADALPHKQYLTVGIKILGASTHFPRHLHRRWWPTFAKQ
jgi:hypothetical protein